MGRGCAVDCRAALAGEAGDVLVCRRREYALGRETEDREADGTEAVRRN